MTTICTGLWEIMNSTFWYRRPLGGGNKLRHYVITYIAIKCRWPLNSLRLVSWTTTTTTTTTKTATIVAGYLTFLGNQAGKYYPSMFIFLIGEEVNNECFETAELFCDFHAVRQAIVTYWLNWSDFLLEMRSDRYPAKLRGENYVLFGVQHVHKVIKYRHFLLCFQPQKQFQTNP